MAITWDEIAEIVKRRRLELGLSQRLAAIRAEVSPTTWASMETHRNPVSDMTQLGVAHALAWPEDWLARLFGGETPDESWSTVPEEISDSDVRAELAEVKGMLRQVLDRLPADG